MGIIFIMCVITYTFCWFADNRKVIIKSWRGNYHLLLLKNKKTDISECYQ